MNDKTVAYLSLGVGVVSLVILTMLAMHLNDTADKVDGLTGKISSNPTVKKVLSLFGGSNA